MKKQELIERLKKVQATGILFNATFGGALEFAIGLAEQLDEPQPPRTQGDRIRVMRDEELAKEFNYILRDGERDLLVMTAFGKVVGTEEESIKANLEYFKSEIKE